MSTGSPTSPDRAWRQLPRDDRAWFLAVVAALAAYYLLPWPALSWLLLLALVALAWRRLDLVLAALPLTFPFWYVPKHVTARATFPLSEIVLGVCVAVALARLAIRFARSREPLGVARQARQLWRMAGWPFWLAAGAFLLAGVLGVLVARRPPEALRELRWEVVEPLVYLVLLLAQGNAPALWRRSVAAFLSSAVLLAGLAALQIAIWHVTFAPLAAGNALVPLAPDPDGTLRATGLVYGSGNSLGAYLERALPLAGVFALLPRRQTGVSPRVRWLCGGLCLAYVLALVWSQSRGAWVGAAVAAVTVGAALLWRTPLAHRLVSLRGAWLAGMTAGVVAVLALLGALWGRMLLGAALAGHNGSGEMRGLLWLSAWHMLRDHPVLGVGLDQFLYYYSPLYTAHPYWITVLNGHPTIAWREPDLAHPHNLVLDLWLSVGVLGLAAFASVLIAFFRRCARLWLDAGAAGATVAVSGWASLALGAGAAMLAGLVHGMVDSAYFEPDLALVFWWLVALVLLASTQARNAAEQGQATALPATGGAHAAPR